MKTIHACLLEAQRLQCVSDTARLDAEVLLSHVLAKDRAYLYAWPEQALNQAQWEYYDHYLKRREKGEPIAYIIGSKEFFSLELLVNQSTLIPRPETELLVESALELSIKDHNKIRCLDLGTGTGAIALAIASQRPNWQITALEKNTEAVNLAKRNRQALKITNVDIRPSDWFSVLDFGCDQFDMIMSNPPYIDPKDSHLHEGDVRFEPSSALIAENAGLHDLAYIIQTAPNFLLDHGWLILEHGFQQADAVAVLFKRHGFVNHFIKYDLAGHCRVSGAQLISI